MTLLENIRDIILKDKEEKENRYWKIEYKSSEKMLVIHPIKSLTYQQVTFMGEWLSKDCYWNSYLLNLKNNYPIDIKFTPCDGCQITYDTKRLRKYKIDKLLNK